MSESPRRAKGQPPVAAQDEAAPGTAAGWLVVTDRLSAVSATTQSFLAVARPRKVAKPEHVPT